MTEYPYGRLPNAYLNVKEAAKEPWRGITAWVQGDPYLIIDKTDAGYVLEGENGKTLTTSAIERWQSATEASSLVAASRLEGSPFAEGEKVGSYTVGSLVYFEDEWHSRVADSELALPLDRLVARYDAVRWDKHADLYPGMDYRCPECGSRDVVPSGAYDHSIYECQDCGKQGYEEEFEDEEPDRDDVDDSFYNDWTGAKVADFEDEHLAPQGEGGMNSFDYQLPPASIHMRTHAAMGQAGLRARVHFPPGIQGAFGPVPEVIDVPSQSQDHVFPVMMIDNPEQYTVRVETPNDPEQVRQLFDQVGGRRSAKTAADTDANEMSGPTKEALKCPKCGSHSLRAYSPSGNVATLVCLTCGNEFDRQIHINPEASVKEAVTPIDPNTSAQVIGLMQQIEEAYQQNDVNKAQQLHKQMLQLMNNPNQPLTQQVAALGPQYPEDPESQNEIQQLMQQIATASASGDVLTLRTLRQHLEMLLGGNPAYASMDKHSPGKDHLPYATPKRNRQYEHILESCKVDHPDWSEDQCKELAARTVNKERAEKGETKSSVITNESLTSTPEEYNLDTMTFDPKHAQGTWYDDGDPYAGQEQDLDPYAQQGLDPTMDDSDSSIDYVHCPACDGPGVLLGQLGNRIHYRCRNCGMDFNEKIDPNHTGQDRDQPFGEGHPDFVDPAEYAERNLRGGSYEDAKEVNQNSLRAFKDSSGNPIEAGRLYTLHHPSYKVPDVVKILNLEHDRIEAAIASDEYGSFPIHITHDDAYSLDPVEHKTASGWSVIARRNFSADEQRELIEENPDGRARNFDKLNLEGTHYNLKEEATDPNFLLGW